MKKAILIFNGSAGIGKVRQYAYQVIEELTSAGYRTEVWPILPDRTNYDPCRMLEQYGEDIDLVVCAGGDGTLFHLVNSLMRMKNKPLLGYLPLGSTNDFARVIPIPTEPEAAIEVLTHGHPFSYDIGKFNGLYFNYVAAFGAFAAVSYSTDQNTKNMLGHAAYTINGLSHFAENLSYRRHLHIKADHFHADGEYIFGAVYNAATIGGFQVAGKVTPDNGKFDLLLVKAPDNLMEVTSILNALTNQEIDSCPEILHREISNAEITFDEPTAWTTDGDFAEEGTVFRFQVCPRAITILR